MIRAQARLSLVNGASVRDETSYLGFPLPTGQTSRSNMMFPFRRWLAGGRARGRCSVTRRSGQQATHRDRLESDQHCGTCRQTFGVMRITVRGGAPNKATRPPKRRPPFGALQTRSSQARFPNSSLARGDFRVLSVAEHPRPRNPPNQTICAHQQSVCSGKARGGTPPRQTHLLPRTLPRPPSTSRLTLPEKL